MSLTTPSKPDIAIIMRSDEVIKKFNLKRITIDTSFGPVHRCYYGTISGKKVLIIYGRFEGQKVTSDAINAQQTIEAVANSGAKKLIGTFIVGGIKKSNPLGRTYIVQDLVGMGNYKFSCNQNYPFHNAEMFLPICRHLTDKIILSSKKMPFDINTNATYVCFHGWPRIETKAELEFYEKMGWDIVGQTLDPEATFARLYGLCYAAIAVQVDDPSSRDVYSKGDIKKDSKKQHMDLIKELRKKSTKLVLETIENLKKDSCDICCKLKRTNNSFKQFPEEFYKDSKDELYD
jgi:purine nucleoside phosphorylase